MHFMESPFHIQESISRRVYVTRQKRNKSLKGSNSSYHSRSLPQRKQRALVSSYYPEGYGPIASNSPLAQLDETPGLKWAEWSLTRRIDGSRYKRFLRVS